MGSTPTDYSWRSDLSVIIGGSINSTSYHAITISNTSKSESDIHQCIGLHALIFQKIELITKH